MRKKISHVNTHQSTQLHPQPNAHTHTQSHMTTHVTQTDLRVRHYSPNPSTSLPLLTHPPWSQLVVSLMQIVGFCFRSICFSIISIIIYIDHSLLNAVWYRVFCQCAINYWIIYCPKQKYR